MKTIKIYGDEFELLSQAQTAIDGYFFKGELFDENPGRGKLLGYAQLLDGSTIACYKAFNPLPIIIPMLVLLLVGGGAATYFFVLQPKDVYVGSDEEASGTPVKVGDDNLMVSYDGFMRVNPDGELELNFQNGNQQCTIEISGEGVATQKITVEPNQFVTTIPVTVTTTEGVVSATINITTETSDTTYDCVVEVPENNTPDSDLDDSSLTGYWRGEYIIGTTVEDIPDNEPTE